MFININLLSRRWRALPAGSVKPPSAATGAENVLSIKALQKYYSNRSASAVSCSMTFWPPGGAIGRGFRSSVKFACDGYGFGRRAGGHL
jgi:hypothetical protein